MQKILAFAVVAMLAVSVPVSASDNGVALAVDKAAEISGDYAELQSLAEQGNTHAQIFLGQHYMRGPDKSSYRVKSYTWFTIAIGLGDKSAIQLRDNFYVAYYRDADRSKGRTNAREWLESYANKAQPNIDRTASSQPVSAGDQEVAGAAYKRHDWAELESMAEQGNAHAAEFLGNSYYIISVRGRDSVKAYTWYTIASEQGSRKAKERLPRVAGRLSAADISKAEAMAREWLEDYAKRTQWNYDRTAASPGPSNQQQQSGSSAGAPGSQSAGSSDISSEPRFDRPWIEEIQGRLAELGYNPGPADGVFGERTGRAIKRYQQDAGLQVTGLPTPSAMQSLRTEGQSLSLAQPAPGSSARSATESVPVSAGDVEAAKAAGGDYPELLPGAQRGNRGALFYLAKSYSNAASMGENRQYNRIMAYTWYTIAIRLGHASLKGYRDAIVGSRMSVADKSKAEAMAREWLEDYAKRTQWNYDQTASSSGSSAQQPQSGSGAGAASPQSAGVGDILSKWGVEPSQADKQPSPSPSPSSSAQQQQTGSSAGAPSSKSAGSSDVLTKWGVQPGQSGSATAGADNRRQPMTDLYPYWLAVKFIPGFLDDKMLLPFVEKEIAYSRTYTERGGREKPWLSYDEVKNRNPKMAAPEFLERYKADIRRFTAQMSTRVTSEYEIGVAKYNRSTGMMHFRPRNDDNDLPTRTILAGQVSADYRGLVGTYGAGGVDEIARRTVGRRLGYLGFFRGWGEKIRPIPGLRVPMVLLQNDRRLGVASIAFDKEMSINGVKMSSRQAELFLNQFDMKQHQSGRFRVRINYTIKGAFSYFHDTSHFKSNTAVFLADVEDAMIYAVTRENSWGPSEKNVVARYKASDFGAPAVTFAALKAQHDAENAQQNAVVQAQQQKARQAEQQRLVDIANLKPACAASESVDESAECYAELCAKIKKARGFKDEEYRWCVGKHRLALADQKREQAAAVSAKYATENEKQRQDMAMKHSCGRKYTGYVAQPWMPAQGTPEYQDAMTACRNEPVRSVYGPDILGFRLGMPMNAANHLIQRQSVKQNTTLKDTRPFEKGALYWSEDANHGIAVFSLVNGEQERVAAVSRRLFMGGKKVTLGQVVKGLRKKYGRELWSNGSDTMLWAFPEGSKKVSANMCSGLASLVEPRAGWNRDWAVSTNRKTAREKRKAQRAANMDAYSECTRQFSAASGATMGAAPSATLMQDLQNCIREKGLMPGGTSSGAAQNTSGKNARLPMMIASNGNPELYEEYKACGPVVIAQANKDGAGNLINISQVLFDPDWISHQPAFAFASGKDGGEIKF